MEWYLKVMRDNYANFSGRARRKEYWMFTLFFALFLIASIFIMAILFSSVSENTGSLIGGILIIGLYLTHLVPSLAVTVRRLHDTGKSGWFYLLVFIPYIGGLIIFIFTVIEGDKGDNKYGADPKASETSTIQKVPLGVEAPIEEISSKEEMTELKNKKRSGSSGWIIFGYISILFAGPIAIAMGAHYALWGKNYDSKTRKNGVIMLVLGVVSFMIQRAIFSAAY